MSYTSIAQWSTAMRNLARKNGIGLKEMQQRFILEEFARKISESKYKDSVILKGGFVVSALLGVEKRTTQDLDFTFNSRIYNSEEAENMINAIANTPTDSFFQYRIKNLKEEQSDDHYSGYRVMLEAIHDKTRLTLKLDISNNTLIYPKYISSNLKSFVDGTPINVFTYPIENIIAEKYETTLDRGEFNTRMRDLLDIYLVYENNEHFIDKNMLAKTIIAVSKDRKTLDNLYHFEELTNELLSSDSFNSTFNRYMEKSYPTMQTGLTDIFDVFKEINELVQEELNSSSGNRKKTLDKKSDSLEL